MKKKKISPSPAHAPKIKYVNPMKSSWKRWLEKPQQDWSENTSIWWHLGRAASVPHVQHLLVSSWSLPVRQTPASSWQLQEKTSSGCSSQRSCHRERPTSASHLTYIFTGKKSPEMFFPSTFGISHPYRGVPGFKLSTQITHSHVTWEICSKSSIFLFNYILLLNTHNRHPLWGKEREKEGKK